MHQYKELKVWQTAVSLVTMIYKVTKDFPSEEMYGLTSQIRRSAVSIPSNIAEGAGRSGDTEFKHFLSIAMGSCFELETQLIIAQDLELLNEAKSNELQEQLNYIQNMIYKLKQSLK